MSKLKPITLPVYYILNQHTNVHDQNQQSTFSTNKDIKYTTHVKNCLSCKEQLVNVFGRNNDLLCLNYTEHIKTVSWFDIWASPHKSKDRFQPQANPCGIYGGHSGTGTCFLHARFGIPVYYPPMLDI